MEQAAATSRMHRVVVMRNLLLTGLGLSLLANVTLSLVLVTGSQSVVLLPAVSSGRAYESGGHVNRAYLEDMARTVAATLLNITPDTGPHMKDSLLGMSHPSFYGAFERQFDAWREEAASRNLSTAFYPARLSADTDALTVTLEGVLKSFIGERQVHAEEITLHLAFDLTGTRLTLLSLREGSLREQRQPQAGSRGERP